jgi:hypothetical protein
MPGVTMEEDSHCQAGRAPSALVACHVEAPLNDAVWSRSSACTKRGRAASTSSRSSVPS